MRTSPGPKAFFFLFLLLVACSSSSPTATPEPTVTPKPTMTPKPTATLEPTATPKPAYAYQNTVNALMALTRDLEFPRHFNREEPIKTGEEFDVNEYLAVLDHLSMEPGYVLDYVYFMSGDGWPIIYARQESEPAYLTYSEYDEAVGGNAFESSGNKEYLDHVQIDGTAEGFFEYTLLYIMGGQFYLQWHANYNDATVVCDPTGVEAILSELESGVLEVPANVWEEALKLDLEPRVELKDDVAVVRVVVFTKWGGFIEETYSISRDFPHKMHRQSEQILVPYDCGINF